MKIELGGMAWNVKLRSTRGNYFVTLKKELVYGNGLRKGSDISYYLVNVTNNTQKKNGILLVLDEDGLDREVLKELNSKAMMVRHPS